MQVSVQGPGHLTPSGRCCLGGVGSLEVRERSGWSANMGPQLAPSCGPLAAPWPYCLLWYLLALDSQALGPACSRNHTLSCWDCLLVGDLHVSPPGQAE